MRRKREFYKQSQFGGGSMKKKTANPRPMEVAPASSR